LSSDFYKKIAQRRIPNPVQNADLIFIKNYDKIYLQGKEMMLSTLPKK